MRKYCILFECAAVQNVELCGNGKYTTFDALFTHILYFITLYV